MEPKRYRERLLESLLTYRKSSIEILIIFFPTKQTFIYIFSEVFNVENKFLSPLEIYRDPLYYGGFATIISVALLLLFALNDNLSDFVTPTFFVAVVLAFGTFFIWKTRCPKCKRPLSKKEKKEWEEDIGIKKKPYTYFSKVYEYSDGTIEKAPGSEKTIMRDKKYERHYYVCKNCNYGSEKEWAENKSQWLGEDPKPKHIKKAGEGAREKRKKNRVPIKTSVRREVLERSGNACQICGNNKTKLHVHHIDKDPSNNKESNLIVLCPNHHAIADSLPRIQLQNAAKRAYRKSRTINIYK